MNKFLSSANAIFMVLMATFILLVITMMVTGA